MYMALGKQKEENAQEHRKKKTEKNQNTQQIHMQTKRTRMVCQHHIKTLFSCDVCDAGKNFQKREGICDKEKNVKEINPNEMEKIVLHQMRHALKIYGNGGCSYSCAAGFRNDGLGKCVSTNSTTCSVGFVQKYGQCLIPSEFVLRQVFMIQNDPNNICDPLCAICNPTDECLYCKPGFTLTSQKTCIACKNCQTCAQNNPENCTSCFPPLALNRSINNRLNNLCQVVDCKIYNCKQCDITGRRCIDCFGGYRPENGNCVKCKINNCYNCLQDVAICSECFYTFLLRNVTVNGSTKECVPCVAGCIDCSESDLSNCTQCIDGYYFDKDQKNINRCYKCIDNCQTCDAKGSCSLCQPGYSLAQSSTKCVLQCSPSCATCRPGFPDQCTSCHTYATLRTSSLRCLINLSCNMTSTCTACPDGYAFGAGQCVKCNTQDLNCAACTYQAPNVCPKCSFGYFLNSNNSCQACTSNCSSCVTDRACLSCIDGFYMASLSNNRSASAVCLKCSPVCLTCTEGPDYCTSCSNTSNSVSKTCVNYTSIDIQASMNITFELFATITNQLFKYFLTQSNKELVDIDDKVQSNSMVLSNLTNGSSVWRLKLSTRNRIASLAIQKSVQAALNKPFDYGGKKYVFQSQKVSANISAQDMGPTSAQLRLILEIGIPMGVLVIVMIVVVIVCLRRRKLDNLYKTPYVPTHKEKEVVKGMQSTNNIHQNDDGSEKMWSKPQL